MMSFCVAAQPVMAEFTPVGPEFRVNTQVTFDQRHPVVAMAESGDFVVVWDGIGLVTRSTEVFGQRFSAGGAAVGAEFQVNTFEADEQTYPTVATASGVGFVVVWHSPGQDGSGVGVFGQRFDEAGVRIGPEFQVNTYVEEHQADADVDMSASGEFVVVWQSGADQDGDGSGVFGQRFNRNGMPLGLEYQVNTLSVGSQTNPAVAVFDTGGFVVTWQGPGADGLTTQVFAQFFDETGRPRGSEIQITTVTGQVPGVAVDGCGDAVIAWESTGGLDGDGLGVFAQRLDNAGRFLGDEFQVNTYPTGDQRRAAVVADGEGGSLVVWNSRDQDGSSWGVFAQSFDGSGLHRGSEYQVNTVSAGSQGPGAVASNSNDSAIVVWESPAEFGEDDVFAQRLAAAPFETACSDGLDDDADGLADCLDPDCCGDPACPQPPETLCGDGIDQDCDCLFDCADPDCAADPSCVSPEDCRNGLDDDGDGDLDCDDADCACDPAACPRADCDGDGRENEGDCAPEDETASELPVEPELRAVRLAGPLAAELSWADQRATAGTGTVQDVASDLLSVLRETGAAGAPCLVEGLPGTSYEDDRPVTDDGFYYLVRAVNACGPPRGEGWGRDSAGVVRPACP